MRPMESYRGYRRNHKTGSWDHKWQIEPKIRVTRMSFIRRKPSKYMPHDHGKGYKPTVPVTYRQPPAQTNKFRGNRRHG